MATTTPKLGLYKPELTDTVGTTIGTHLPANLDVLDDLAAQANSYTSGVSGFAHDSIKAALDALAGVRIVEMASNSNGTYVRWENGLQVCFGGQGAAGFISNATYRLNWTYPAAFVGAPTAVGARSNDGTTKGLRLTGPSIRDISATIVNYYINDPSGSFADGETWYIYPIAIGRWK